ncbi:MAG TPA: polyphenol oxidase family protein [Thermoanaerobaculaceae bacterium]|nr:polyphenol oxidase family protein [Thermoanaerobaculaceae bacterium]HPS77569.1 polyphenol oxidase family protein [Thermoanaerobaculaceae bacterium]
MDSTAPDPGILHVPLANGMVCFADSSASPFGADERQLAEAARTHLEDRLGRTLPVLYALQQHGAVTFLYAARGQLVPGAHEVGRCDGLITVEPGVGLVVRNADCLPVALAGGGAMAMLHAGWRGLAADILGRVVKRLEGELGVSSGEVTAVIGPGVGPCHYEVGPEIAAALQRNPTDESGWRSEGRVDLARYAAARLRSLGVLSVQTTGICTACSPRYYSYRRDGTEAGRLWSAAVIWPS